MTALGSTLRTTHGAAARAAHPRVLKLAVRILSCLAIAALPSGVGHTQSSPHFLRSEDLFANQEVKEVVVSPDGKRAALVITRPATGKAERYGLEGFEQRGDIWILPRHGSPTNVTHGYRDGSSAWRPIWSPSSDRLVFLSNRGGDNVRLFAWDTLSKAVHGLSDRGVRSDAFIGSTVTPMAWVGATTVLCALVAPGERAWEAEFSSSRRQTLDAAWRRTDRGAEPSVSVLDAGFGSGSAKQPKGELVTIDARTGHTVLLVTADVRTVSISPDGGAAALIAETGRVVLGPDRPPTWGADFVEWHSHYGMQRQLGVVSLRGAGSVRWVSTVSAPYFADHARAWSADGSHFTVASDSGLTSPDSILLVVVSRDGTVERPLVRASSASRVVPSYPYLPPPTDSTPRLWTSSAATGFAVYISTPPNGTVVWAREKTGAQLRERLRLNAHLRHVLPDVGTPRVFHYLGADHRIYAARVVLPVGYRAGTRYPLIVKVYPGYFVSDTLGSGRLSKPHALRPELYTDLLPVHGYAVLSPTIPPSTGEPIVTMPGFVLPAVDSLIDQGIADSSRLGLIGHSHGGIAVYGLLTQTRRFKAAVTWNGWSDILHYYASFVATYCYCATDHDATTPDGLQLFEATDTYGNAQAGGLYIGSTPWADPARWSRNNPIDHVDRIETPLMIVRSDNDAFYMSDGDLAYQSLYRLGKRVRYVRYWGEPHNMQSPANMRDLWVRIAEWFDAYLGARPASQ